MKYNRKRRNVWLRLLGFATPQAGIFTLSIIFGIASHLCAVFFMTSGAMLILRAVRGGEFSWTWMAVTLGTGILKAFFRLGEQYLGHDGAFRLLARLRKELFIAVDELSPAFLSDTSRGDICAAVMADVELVEVFFAHTIAPVVIAFVVPAAVLVYTGLIWIGFPAILFPLYLVLGVLFPCLSRAGCIDAGKVYLDIQGKTHGFCLEAVQGSTDILSLHARPLALDRLKALSERGAGPFLQMKTHEGRGMMISEIITVAASCLLFVGGCLFSGNGTPEVDRMFAGMIAGMSSFGPVLALTAVSSNWLSTGAAAGRIFDVLDRKSPVHDTGKEEPKEGNVSWRSVGFSYGEEGPMVLRDFSLDAAAGGFTIIEGASGCGKSTALHLLFRYWDPLQGRITSGGTDLKHLDLSSHRRSLALLVQDTYLFRMSILDNLKLADPSASYEKITAAARSADIHDFIESLPAGYDTPVAELGSSLSSGEKQRMGLARLFLQNASVWVFDEPTSKVDALSEARIIAALEADKKSRTKIMVTHRKYLFSRADKVIRLENGKGITERIYEQ